MFIKEEQYELNNSYDYSWIFFKVLRISILFLLLYLSYSFIKEKNSEYTSINQATIIIPKVILQNTLRYNNFIIDFNKVSSDCQDLNTLSDLSVSSSCSFISDDRVMFIFIKKDSIFIRDKMSKSKVFLCTIKKDCNILFRHNDLTISTKE